MAYPAPEVVGTTTTWEKTANTWKRDVDPKLWAALTAKSPVLDMLPRPKVGNFKFEWPMDVAVNRSYTSETVADSITGTALSARVLLKLTSVHQLEAGTLLKNVTRATTVGSYGQDEILEVRSIDKTTRVVTVLRDAASQAGVDANSAAHADGDVYEVIYTPKPEGSGPDENKYTDIELVYNMANSVDFYLTVTGDQAATEKLVADDTLQNQFNKNLLKLNNDLERMFFYGALNATAEAGSAAEVRRTKGFDSFVGALGGNFDVSGAAIDAAKLDLMFYQIMEDATDPSDPFMIACHPHNARKISAFGIERVRMGQEETKYGRHIDVFKSDLGVEADIIWSLNISKGDIFIIDKAKVELPMFRPFQMAEWSYGDDGVDIWRQRYLGSFGVKVVDALKSHAKIGLLSRA